MRTLIFGWNGHGNFGDDVMLDVLLDKNRDFAVWGSTKFVKSVGLRRTLINVVYDTFFQIPYVARVVPYILGVLIPSDSKIIFGGGKLFATKHALLFYVRLIQTMHSLGKRVVVVGYGVSLYHEEGMDENRLKRLVSYFEFLYVRDEVSLNYCSKFSSVVEYALDPAFYKFSRFKRVTCANDYTINVSLRSGLCKQSDIELVRDAISNFVNTNQNKTIRIRLFSFSNNRLEDDIIELNRLADILADLPDVNLEVYPYTSMNHLINSWAHGDYCICQRLHSAILSTALNIPFSVLAYDQKLTDFTRNLTPINMELRADSITSQLRISWSVKREIQKIAELVNKCLQIKNN